VRGGEGVWSGRARVKRKREEGGGGRRKVRARGREGNYGATCVREGEVKRSEIQGNTEGGYGGKNSVAGWRERRSEGGRGRYGKGKVCRKRAQRGGEGVEG